MKLKNISKRKERGIIALVLIIVVITFLPRLLDYWFPSERLEVDFESVNTLVAEIDAKKTTNLKGKSYVKKKRFKAPPSSFNPNDYTLEEWMNLGLSEKQANVILKFSKYGIKDNEQLKQIFVIDDELFQLIKDSTFYPEKQYANAVQNKAQFKNKAKKELLNLNTATIEELVELPGIGDYSAKKIVEYRTKLGGFVQVDQLLEIHNFPTENIEKFRHLIVTPANSIQRINVNTCTYKELVKHPYVTKNVANSIVKIRAKYQKYSNFDQLLESELISQELLNKLKPYLTLGDE
jgi:competence protein ComEA